MVHLHIRRSSLVIEKKVDSINRARKLRKISENCFLPSRLERGRCLCCSFTLQRACNCSHKIFTTLETKKSALVVVGSAQRGELMYGGFATPFADTSGRRIVNRDGLAKLKIVGCHLTGSFPGLYIQSMLFYPCLLYTSDA